MNNDEIMKQGDKIKAPQNSLHNNSGTYITYKNISFRIKFINKNINNLKLQSFNLFEKLIGKKSLQAKKIAEYEWELNKLKLFLDNIPDSGYKGTEIIFKGYDVNLLIENNF